MQGSKLTLARLPEARWNRLGQIVFGFNLPDGQANKIQHTVLNNVKKNHLEIQFRSAFVAIE